MDKDREAEQTPLRGAGQEQSKASPVAAPDGGWGYVVLAAVVVSFGLIGGIHLTTTLIYQALLDKFQKSATATSWVIGLQGCLSFCFSPISSLCCNRFGFRVTTLIGTCMSAGGIIASAFPTSLAFIYITFGIMSGIGHSLIAISGFTIVPMYFDKKLGKANAIASMGVTMGSLVLAPLLTFLFSKYGYTGTMLILGGLILHIFIFGMLFRSPPGHERASAINPKSTEMIKYTSDKDENVTSPNEIEENETKQSKTDAKSSKWEICSKYLNLGVFKEIQFVAFTASMVCFFYAISSNTFLAGLAKERHINDTLIAVILVVTSIGTCISKIVSGILFDLKWIKERRTVIFCLLGILAGILYSLVPFASDFPSLLIANMCSNIIIHAVHGQHITILSDIIGRTKVVSALGICRLIMGIGFLSGPVVGGALKDCTGTYNHAYYVSGSLTVLGMIIFLLTIAYKMRNKQN